jgi:hypothetical protein
MAIAASSYPSTYSTSGYQFRSGGVLTISHNIREVISTAPGFSPLAFAIDRAEHFPGLIIYWPEYHLSDIIDPMGPLMTAFLRSMFESIMANLLPFAIRATVTIVGAVLLMGLLLNGITALLPSISFKIGGRA